MATEDRLADANLLADTFSSRRDRGADSAAPESKTEVEEIKQEVEPPKEEEPKAETKTEEKDELRDEKGRFAARVPLSELQSEREKRQEAQKARDEEARLRREAEDNARRYQSMLDDMQRRAYAAQQPQPQQPVAPDPLTDPDGWARYQQEQFQTMLMHERANMSEVAARRAFGDEAVDKAVTAATQANIAAQFLRARDPYGALLEWHKRQMVLSEIGPDPEKYKTSIRDQIRQEVLAELQKNGTAGSQAAQQRFPGTLADKTASGPSGAMPVSDESVMGEVFGHGRRRK